MPYSSFIIPNLSFKNMFSRRQFLTTGSTALAGLPLLHLACIGGESEVDE
ncbi:MAG: hypothetical protein AB8G22_28780 [Saprospiraceae bacterium]